MDAAGICCVEPSAAGVLQIWQLDNGFGRTQELSLSPQQWEGQSRLSLLSRLSRTGAAELIRMYLTALSLSQSC